MIIYRPNYSKSYSSLYRIIANDFLNGEFLGLRRVDKAGADAKAKAMQSCSGSSCGIFSMFKRGGFRKTMRKIKKRIVKRKSMKKRMTKRRK
jgi:hypothetical protein